MKQPVLHIDFETRSTVDLRKTGVHVYAEDPATDVICAAFAVGDGDIDLWTPEPVQFSFLASCLPREVERAVEERWPIYAHNAAFERCLWRHVLGPRYGWPVPDDSQWRCTMVQAHAMALPGSLDAAALALSLPFTKDLKGHALMLQMCKPRRIEPDGTIIWWEDIDRLQRLYDYCKHDVVVERELHKRLVPLKASELALWHLDMQINDRGVAVDDTLCENAKKIVKATTKKLDEEMSRVTGHFVTACSQVQQLAIFVRQRGVDVDNLDKEMLTELLVRDDLPEDVRRALELRQEAAKASVSKIDALLRGKSSDGRARGLLQFHAASTGRWSGRRFQPQNLKRPDDKFDVPGAIDVLLGGSAEVVGLLYDRPLDVVANCIRGTVVAESGSKLVTADFSSIEGRGLPWLAGDERKVKVFRELDAGSGLSPYYITAGNIFGVDPKSVKKGTVPYQCGKVGELALGYQGGPAAFKRMAKGYAFKIEEHYDVIMEAARPEFVDGAEAAWEDYGSKSGLDKRAWIPGEAIKQAWRVQHPEICGFWTTLEEAALEAVESPGKICWAGDKIAFRREGSFLWMRLPSGRCICYPYPKVIWTDTPWGSKKPTVEYFGQDTFTRKWGRVKTYGGQLCNNATQGTCRDVLAEAMVRVEAAGYPVILTVHDEAVSEVPEAFGSLADFEALMIVPPAWADGFPIAAEGWVGDRYRK